MWLFFLKFKTLQASQTKYGEVGISIWKHKYIALMWWLVFVMYCGMSPTLFNYGYIICQFWGFFSYKYVVQIVTNRKCSKAILVQSRFDNCNAVLHYTIFTFLNINCNMRISQNQIALIILLKMNSIFFKMVF